MDLYKPLIIKTARQKIEAIIKELEDKYLMEKEIKQI